MKKNVANLIRINSEYDAQEAENLLRWRFERAILEGYPLPKHDCFLYCAILIKRNGMENLPEIFKRNIIKNNELNTDVNFHLLRLKVNDKIELREKEKELFNHLRREKVNERKVIIKKEIGRLTLKGKIRNTINHTNSLDYKELLYLTRSFGDVTLLDWFIPIVLKYERLIHIFVRHVEETKFAESQTKKRTFFSYKSTEIWTLLKTLIKQEAEEIKEHFIENSVNYSLGKPELMKAYHRTEKNPILYDGDNFSLEIDKNGFIMKFHQI
jgi:hypothetical protein